MKKILSLICVFLILIVSGCAKKTEYEKYSYKFYNTFDTMVQIIGYVEKEEDFDKYMTHAQDRMMHFHKLYDKYNRYDGINNIKTINDNAGITPVKVDKEIIELLEMSIEWYNKTDGIVNVAYGPVLTIWHDYREMYEHLSNGKIPTMEELDQASDLCKIEDVVIDKENSTVFLKEEGMSLDVGAIAKGYATEIIGNELYNMGFKSYIISSGGNIRVYDPPLNHNKTSWGMGVQDPKKDANNPEQEYLDTLFVNNTSVVSSGNYQRFYFVDGQRIHHIIDPRTNMPANNFASVMVMTEKSGMADAASTALFIMDYEEGKDFAEENGIEVYWIDNENEIEVTSNMIPYLKELGGATSVKKD